MQSQSWNLPNLRRRDTWRKVRRQRSKGVKQMDVRLVGLEEQQAALQATLAEVEASKGLLLRQVCSPIAGKSLFSPPLFFPVNETQMHTDIIRTCKTQNNLSSCPYCGQINRMNANSEFERAYLLLHEVSFWNCVI